MTPGLPWIIATLPATSVASAREQIHEARSAGADIAEVRIDRWNAEEWHRVRELLPAPLPILATFRSRAEGGFGSDDPGERSSILLELVAAGVDFIDCEAARDLAILGQTRADRRPLMVVSSHLPAGTSFTVIRSLLEQPTAGIAFSKVVVPATLSELLHQILPHLPPREAFSYVLHTTGPSGPLLRLWARRLGLAAVYSALPEKTNRPALEPAQIPTDRLRRYWANGDDSPLYAVVGHPVAQSRSPYVHSEWIRAASLRGIYVSLDVADDAEFLDVIPALAESGLRGINVTHPFKRVALTLATRTNPSSEVCRCANMLTFDRKEVIADNTDLIAVLRRLSELRAAGVWEDDRLTIVGTGGAARAALAAAHELRVQAEVLARDPEQAAALGRSFGATTAQVHDPNPVSLLVHATPVGQLGFDAMEIALDGWIGNGTYVLDFVYSPASTWLFDLARRNGAAYEDGWRLLVYQAAASFEIWWGVAPDAKTTDRLLEES